MATRSRDVRVGAPLMHAFRTAHANGDAGKKPEANPWDERVIEGRRATSRTLVDERLLRREVERDLEVLLNTVDLNSTQPLDAYPEVRRSIVDFGIPDIVHRTIDEEGVNDIVREIETAIRTHEPRLAPRSISVRRDTTFDVATLRVRFVVAAELLVSPENIPIEFVAEIEVDSGKISLTRARPSHGQ